MCGLVGLIGREDAGHLVARGLAALQHRGQDATGVAVLDRSMRAHHRLALVADTLTESVLDALPGAGALGHVRYATHGDLSLASAQPFVDASQVFALCHSGQLTNASALRERVLALGLTLASPSDSELLQQLVSYALRDVGNTPDQLVAALQSVTELLEGSYTVAVLLRAGFGDALLVFRDPHGLRPGMIGRGEDGAWAVASESVALAAMGLRPARDIVPGEAVLLVAGQEAVSLPLHPATPRHCAFERVYFASPASRLEGSSVSATRRRLGDLLGEQLVSAGLVVDVVVPVPRSARAAAAAVAARLGVPMEDGLTATASVGRAFIQPEAAARAAALSHKFVADRSTFADRRVLLVDDSLVRGATMNAVAGLVREQGPAAVHVAIVSPPVRHPCFFGIDFPSRGELIATRFATPLLEASLAEWLQVESVTFLFEQSLSDMMGPSTCAACFTGVYPVTVSEKERSFILTQRGLER